MGTTEVVEIDAVVMTQADIETLEDTNNKSESIKTSTPSTSKARGKKRQADDSKGKKSQKTKPDKEEKSITELFGASCIEQGEILLKEMTHMRVLKGMEKSLRRKATDASKLPKKGISIKDKKLEEEVQRVVRATVGDPTKSVAELKRLHRQSEKIVEDLWTQTLRAVNTNQKSLLDLLQQLVSNAKLRMKIEMSGRACLTSASTEQERLMILAKKPPSTIVIDSSYSSDGELHGEEGWEIAQTEENIGEDMERLESLEEDYNKNKHECQCCAAMFVNLKDLDKHGRDAHSSLYVRKKK